jgi:uncharacterized iron-regulated membrane protein
VRVNWRVWWRKCHRWGSLLVALPFLLVILTGVLLQLKKEWTWIQPPTTRGEGKVPTLAFDAILSAVRTVPQAEVRTWGDVDRLDVRPGRGIAKVVARNRWEVQIDLKTATILHVAYRRSDLIETLHDGSWFHEHAKLWVFLPVALVVLGLWLTGMYLFILPYSVRWSKRNAPHGRVPARRRGVPAAEAGDRTAALEVESGP